MRELIGILAALLLFDTFKKPSTMGTIYPNPNGKSRGMRNNNPGNIKETGTKWKGQIKPTGDQPFAQFIEPKWGVRAMIILIKRTYRNMGLVTIRQIISRYAPPSENITEAYINAVSKDAGMGADEVISYEDQYKRIIQAMAKHENGLPVSQVLPDSLYYTANNLI